MSILITYWIQIILLVKLKKEMRFHLTKGVIMRNFIGLVAFFMSLHTWADVPVHEDRNEAEYNHQYAVVLNGFDPVSYFPEGGGSPLMGLSKLKFTYGTRIYHFASQENLDAFKANPLRYEPTYGSYCAFGMANNAKIEINPLVFTLNENRLHLFINKSAKRSFDLDVADHEDRADLNFFNRSGEKPRK